MSGPEYRPNAPRHISRIYKGLVIFTAFCFLLGLAMWIQDLFSPSWFPALLGIITIIVTFFFHKYLNREVDGSKFYGDIETCTRCGGTSTVTMHDHTSASYWQEDCSECSGKGKTEYPCIVRGCLTCHGWGSTWYGNKKVTCPCVLENYKLHTKDKS